LGEDFDKKIKEANWDALILTAEPDGKMLSQMLPDIIKLNPNDFLKLVKESLAPIIIKKVITDKKSGENSGVLYIFRDNGITYFTVVREEEERKCGDKNTCNTS